MRFASAEPLPIYDELVINLYKKFEENKLAHNRSWLNLFGLACLLCIFNVAISTPTMVVAQTDSCADTLVPRLTIGTVGRVTHGNSNNVRDTPSTTGKLVGKLPGGESFKVMDGPTCADGFNWWQVHTTDFDGWTVEADNTDYWLRPYAPTLNMTTKDNVSHIEYHELPNISFDLDSTLANGVDYDFSIANWASESPLPEYVCINLKIDPPQDFPYNHLCVVKTTEMQAYVESLNQILTEEPAFDSPNGRTEIPVPFGGAAQFIQAQMHYLETDTLRGIGFVTFYAQDYFPVTNNGLEYNFSGVTKDGKYIVSFAYRISSAVLSNKAPTNQEIDASHANPSKYYRSVVDKLNLTSHADFMPNLDSLDAIINSIVIK
jgi:hypothetical protein